MDMMNKVITVLILAVIALTFVFFLSPLIITVLFVIVIVIIFDFIEKMFK